MWTITGRSLALAALLAATTGVSTKDIRTAAPTNTINLSGEAAAEGSSLSVLRADAKFGISGTLPVARGGTGGLLPEANGGTGVGALTCAAGTHITSNGTLYSCSADTYISLVRYSALCGAPNTIGYLFASGGSTAACPATGGLSYGPDTTRMSFTWKISRVDWSSNTTGCGGGRPALQIQINGAAAVTLTAIGADTGSTTTPSNNTGVAGDYISIRFAAGAGGCAMQQTAVSLAVVPN